MSAQILGLLRDSAGLLSGGVIGLAFGSIQQAALRRHERLQQEGRLTNGWAVLPGSGRRVAYLLIALALVQFLCPLLFVEGTQWWVSAGLVLGYGWLLFRQLRQRMQAAPAGGRAGSVCTNYND